MKVPTILTTLLLLVLLVGLPLPAQAQDDSLAVSLLGHIDLWTWRNANDIEVAGNHAYIVTDDPALYILDITDPATPVEVGRFFQNAEPEDLLLLDDTHALLLCSDRLVSLELSVPAAPAILDTLHLDGFWSSMDVEDGLAVVGGGMFGLVFIDVSDLTSLSVLASLNPQEPVWGPAMADQLLAVNVDETRTTLLDISDPTDPVMMADLEHPDGGPFDPIKIRDDILYRLFFNELAAWDISDPSNPQALGAFDVGPGNGRLLTLDEDRAYVMRNQYGLRVIDVSDPTAMESLGTLHLGALLGGLEAQSLTGSHLLFTGGEYLTTIDVADPAAMSIENNYIPPDSWNGIYTEGNRVYLDLHTDAIRGYDVSDPSSPIELGEWPLEQDGFSTLLLIGVHRGFAYLASSTFIHIYDVSTPGVNPSPTQIHLNYTAKQAAFAGDRVYLTVGNWGYPDMGGVMMLSAPPTETPELLWSDIRLGWYSPQVALDQGRLITFHGRFVVYDLTLGPEPVEVADVDVSHGSRGFDVENGIAYVADYGLSYSVLHVHDLRDLDDIHEIDAITTTEQWPGIVEARGDQLCVDMTPYQVGSGHGGMFVMDVSDPADSHIRGFHKEVHFLEWMSGSRALVRGNGFIGVVDISGATAVDEDQPLGSKGPAAAFALLPTYPNPFNPTATVRINTPIAGPVRITIHDLLGRTVATLGNPRLNAGTHQWVIDGSSWASGVYLVRAQGPGGQLRTERITLVK